MHDQDSRLPWMKPAWRAEMDGWIAGCLAPLGLTARGPAEQIRVRPWSTVLRAPVTDGVVYAKQAVAVQGYEAALTGRLAERYPAALPPVLAADPATHRLLLGDAGAPLSSVVQPAAYFAAWHRALADYAAIQIETAADVDGLLAMGLPDRRLAVLPGLYQRLLESEAETLAGLTGGLTAAEIAALHALARNLRARCERLAALGLPETLQHNDLHDNNVFVSEGHAVVADWADACITHPFTMLGETLASISRRRALAGDDPALTALRRAYLSAFRHHADDATLEQAARLAEPLGLVCGILTAEQIALGVDPEFRDDMWGFEVEWLRRLLPLLRDPA